MPRKRKRRRKFRKEFLILVWTFAALIVVGIIVGCVLHNKKGQDTESSLSPSAVSESSENEQAEENGENNSGVNGSEPVSTADAAPVSKRKQELIDGKKTIDSIAEKLSGIETDVQFNAAVTDGHPYLVAVNRTANCVTVYTEGDDGRYTRPYRAMVCSTGGENTPLGVWNTPTEAESPSRPVVHALWHLMDGNVYAQYVTRITPNDGILFHSIPYWTNGDKSSLEYDEFNKLGETASLGCVRLSAVDSQWIYDNCPYGTMVVIYDDAANPGPLGKPETLSIDVTDESLRGWDPTDPDPDNPWDDSYLAGTAISGTME